MLYSQFKIFNSNDVSAPVLTGTSGSLVAVLSASLVEGYGNTPSAGWSLEYTSSDGNGAAFRPPSGSRFYLTVDDTAPSAAKTGEARIAGFETLTTWNTGLMRFPPEGSILRARKSSTTDTTARPWTIFADSYTMYMFIYSGDTTTHYAWMFGDIYSLQGESDVYRCMIMGGNNENSATEYADYFTPIGTQTGGHWLARRYPGISGSIASGKMGDSARGFTTALNYMYGFLMYPNGTDKSIHISPIWVHEGSVSYCLRGKMRGMWYPCHAADYFPNGHIIEGMGETVGRKFMTMNRGFNSGIFLMEISPTVETN